MVVTEIRFYEIVHLSFLILDFRLCGDKDRYQVCEKALKQVVMQLQHLNRIWTEVQWRQCSY